MSEKSNKKGFWANSTKQQKVAIIGTTIGIIAAILFLRKKK